MAELDTPSPARMQEIYEKTRNWGRWGADDERGALNLITRECQLAAAACIESGRTVSCARDLPVQPAADNPHPALHMMVNGGDDCVIPGFGLEQTTDFVGVAFHGMATSHLDALCHVFVKGKMYNGFDASEVKSTGARRCSVMVAEHGIHSRGVLLDIPRLEGRPWLEPNEPITPAQLDAAEAAQGIAVGAGDILLIGTGRDARRDELGPWDPVSVGFPGLHPECLPWLRERDVAVLGCDGISDMLPGLGIPEWPVPVHQVGLSGMGVHLLDNLKLDDLSAACAEAGRWAFHLAVAPLRVAGGTGSPVNPIATL